MPTVLIICTGNTCRSPMAAALLRDALARSGVTGVEVISRGFAAPTGAPASGNAQLAVQARGLDITEHRAARLTAGDAARAHLVLVMDEYSRAQFIAQYGGGERVHVISPGGVHDPFGGGTGVYENCAAQLERDLTRFLDIIKEIDDG